MRTPGGGRRSKALPCGDGRAEGTGLSPERGEPIPSSPPENLIYVKEGMRTPGGGRRSKALPCGDGRAEGTGLSPERGEPIPSSPPEFYSYPIKG
jgi:hypothetical protein